MNNDNSIKSIINDTLNIKQIQACFIFGSYGTGNFTENSDIDIAVISDLDTI